MVPRDPAGMDVARSKRLSSFTMRSVDRSVLIARSDHPYEAYGC